MEWIFMIGLAGVGIGFLLGRLSLRDGQGTGGGQVRVRGHLIQLDGWMLIEIHNDVMTPAEQAALIKVQRLQLRGRPVPTHDQAVAEQAWISSVERWLLTPNGETWAARTMPQLLGE